MKVLFYKYDDNSAFGIVRIYAKKDYQQADKDLELLQTYGSDSKLWYLTEVELFNKKKMNKKYKQIDALNQVAEFHKLFKAPILTEPTVIEKSRSDLRVKLLQEELDELKQAIEDNSIVEIADALCDLQYVLSGAVLEFGLGDKFTDLFDEVHKSNMSKACKTEEEAKKTQDYYINKRHTDSYREKQENGTWLVFRVGDDKVLKSINYSPANLEDILNNTVNILPHQQRVLDEKAELDDKCAKLTEFVVNNPVYKTLDPEERADMYMQLQQMLHYSDTLQRRINRF